MTNDKPRPQDSERFRRKAILFVAGAFILPVLAGAGTAVMMVLAQAPG